jgi:hypothetical protein
MLKFWQGVADQVSVTGAGAGDRYSAISAAIWTRIPGMRFPDRAMVNRLLRAETFEGR